VQALRGDDPVEAICADEARDVDRGHSAARDGRVEDIPSERAGLRAFESRLDRPR
jgi:hypothetical protein